MMARRSRLARNPMDEVLSLWPSRPVLASEIGATAAQVDKWASAGRIPAEWQFWVVESARKNGFTDITPEWMLKYHSGFAKRAVDGVAK